MKGSWEETLRLISLLVLGALALAACVLWERFRY